MCLYREAEALNSEIRHPGSVHCSFTVFWYCQSQGTSRGWAVPLLRKVPQRDIYHLLKGSLPMRTTWKASLQQVLDLHKAEFKGDEFLSCISMSAWKVEDNDTLVSQSAHLKITGVGTAVKVLWRGTKVSGRKEFEINKLGASQVLGNIFPWEEERQELWKKKACFGHHWGARKFIPLTKHPNVQPCDKEKSWLLMRPEAHQSCQGIQCHKNISSIPG